MVWVFSLTLTKWPHFSNFSFMKWSCNLKLNRSLIVFLTSLRALTYPYYVPKEKLQLQSITMTNRKQRSLGLGKKHDILELSAHINNFSWCKYIFPCINSWPYTDFRKLKPLQQRYREEQTVQINNIKSDFAKIVHESKVQIWNAEMGSTGPKWACDFPQHIPRSSREQRAVPAWPLALQLIIEIPSTQVWVTHIWNDLLFQLTIFNSSSADTWMWYQLSKSTNALWK